MKRITKIELLPVLSFHPVHFDIKEQYPSGLNLEQRHTHWVKMMNRANFHDLEPIATGYDLVRTTQLSKESLLQLIKCQGLLVPCHPDVKNEEVLSSIEGGVVMKGNDQILYMPQCCVCFSDYREWLEIKKTDHFHRVWIGHPWMYTHAKGKDLFFSGMIDNYFGKGKLEHKALDDFPFGRVCGEFLADLDIADAKNLMCQFMVNFDLFLKAQTSLEKEVDLFYNRVLAALQEMGISNATTRANSYVKGIGGPPSYDREEPLPILPFTVTSFNSTEGI